MWSVRGRYVVSTCRRYMIVLWSICPVGTVHGRYVFMIYYSIFVCSFVLGPSLQQVRYNVTLNPDNEYEYTCAYTGHTEGGRVKFAEDIRRETLPQAQGSCPKKQPVHAYSADRWVRL